MNEPERSTTSATGSALVHGALCVFVGFVFVAAAAGKTWELDRFLGVIRFLTGTPANSPSGLALGTAVIVIFLEAFSGFIF